MLRATGCHCREPGQTARWLLATGPGCRVDFRPSADMSRALGQGPPVSGWGQGHEGASFRDRGAWDDTGRTKEGAAEPFLQAWAPKPFPGQPSMSLVSSFGEW